MWFAVWLLRFGSGSGGSGVSSGGSDDGVFGSGHGFSGDDPLLLVILIIMFIE